MNKVHKNDLDAALPTFRHQINLCLCCTPQKKKLINNDMVFVDTKLDVIFMQIS